MIASGSVSVYSQAVYAAPSYGRTQFSVQPQLSSAAPYLLSSRFYSSSLPTEETITISQAQRAQASPPQEEEEEQFKEEEKKEEEEEEMEAEEEQGEDGREEEDEAGEKEEEGEEEAEGEG